MQHPIGREQVGELVAELRGFVVAHVRVSPFWRRSASADAECVEVAPGFAVVPVRDSKDPNFGHLVVARASWAAMLSMLRAG
ncbi:DUF397 domain-containing protein [Embleya sp. AB8]|uniref:DUF397 domain-containing protein n=1 Tax=Embleya sp. AB8 TaxID=3156304 RepID=UPI003C7831BD